MTEATHTPHTEKNMSEADGRQGGKINLLHEVKITTLCAERLFVFVFLGRILSIWG